MRRWIYKTDARLPSWLMNFLWNRMVKYLPNFILPYHDLTKIHPQRMMFSCRERRDDAFFEELNRQNKEVYCG